MYGTEELAVNSFLPTRVLPHIHAIIDALEFTEGTRAMLAQKVSEHLGKTLGRDFLPPNIKFSGIHDQKGLFDRIAYMLKPMKLLRPYEQAWAEASWHNRAGVCQLNSELTDVIRGHSQILYRRPKMWGQGTLNPRTTVFIGIPTEDLAKFENKRVLN